MADKVANCIASFKKSHGTQYSFMIMLEKWKRAPDKGDYISALFMDLAEAFDTIIYGVMLIQLEAYDFSKDALKLMKIFLKNRKKFRINHNCSSERDVATWFPEESIDGPLFVLFVNDLVLFCA